MGTDTERLAHKFEYHTMTQTLNIKPEIEYHTVTGPQQVTTNFHKHESERDHYIIIIITFIIFISSLLINATKLREGPM